MQTQPILVLGSSGQVAQAFARHKKVGHHPILCLGRPSMDIKILSTVNDQLSALRPAVVINAAAYTAVDQAEKDRAAAFTLNADGAEIIAQACCEHQIPLIHLSTDYVFDGLKNAPYLETDTVSPLNVYGASKAAGEEAIRRTWRSHLILRAGWIYSLYGNNFLKTMLRLAQEREEISIVDDQRGTPTWADDLVTALAHLVARLLDDPSSVKWGTYHLTNQGETTWFGFALEIFRLLAEKGVRSPVLKPIKSSDYPSVTQRPKYSVLNSNKIEQTFGLRMPEWQVSLAKCLQSLE